MGQGAWIMTKVRCVCTTNSLLLLRSIKENDDAPVKNTMIGRQYNWRDKSLRVTLAIRNDMACMNML